MSTMIPRYTRIG